MSLQPNQTIFTLFVVTAVLYYYFIGEYQIDGGNFIGEYQIGGGKFIGVYHVDGGNFIREY